MPFANIFALHVVLNAINSYSLLHIHCEGLLDSEDNHSLRGCQYVVGVWEVILITHVFHSMRTSPLDELNEEES